MRFSSISFSSLHAVPCSGRPAQVIVLPAVLCLLVLVTGSALADVSRDDAIRITTDALLGGSLADVRMYIYPLPIAASTSIASWRQPVFTAPSEGWFLFIDRMPAANWEHPCQYVFVDCRSGALQVHDAQVPPRLQRELEEVTHGRDNPPPGESAAAHAWLDRRLKEIPKPNPPQRGRPYAFIISGGADAGNNHIRYWNDCSFIYKCLVNYYGYADADIYVCISDGTNPAPDRSDGTNSPSDLDGDGDPDIQYPATMQYITQVFNQLATILTAGDQLFIFTTDHGGSEGGWNSYLNLWNWETLRDDQLAAFVNALPCETVVGTFEQCYSGGMIDDLAGDHRIISTACRYDQVSWAMGPSYIYDAYVYHWTCAVNWQDPYGNPVDADTNDDGIISMREAFAYAEAHDQESEDPQYSSTPPDLGESITLYGTMEGVYLTLEGVTFDDDGIGASHGDGDGQIDYNETIEVTVALSNIGNENGFDIQGTLTCPSRYVAFAEDKASFGDIPSDGYATNASPLIFHVAHDVPDGETLAFTLDVSEEPRVIRFPDRVVRAPEYEVSILDIDDSGGDGDGIADPGERVGLTFHVRNTGSCASPAMEVVLGTGSEYFTPDPAPHALRALNVDDGETLAEFIVTVAPDCPEIYTHYLRLEMHGPDLYERMIPVLFSIGQVFADNMESGAAYWTHYAGQGTWLDPWHLETYRNHTGGGTTSWKCGGAGSATYGNRCYAFLETTAFDLPPFARLSFWQWCDAETSNIYTGYAFDGGLLQISTNGGANWSRLTPEGGYPFRIRTRQGGNGPFAAETPVWSGHHSWRHISVNLAGYSGEAKLRWVFGSDAVAGREGLYIDDVSICADAPSGTGDDVGRAIRPRLLPARPNPVMFNGAGGALVIRFASPEAKDASVQIFDASGRLVCTLYRGRAVAGMNEAVWDGRDADGRAAPAGSYYYRLTIGDEARSGRLALIR